MLRCKQNFSFTKRYLVRLRSSTFILLFGRYVYDKASELSFYLTVVLRTLLNFSKEKGYSENSLQETCWVRPVRYIRNADKSATTLLALTQGISRRKHYISMNKSLLCYQSHKPRRNIVDSHREKSKYFLDDHRLVKGQFLSRNQWYSDRVGVGVCGMTRQNPNYRRATFEK